MASFLRGRVAKGDDAGDLCQPPWHERFENRYLMRGSGAFSVHDAQATHALRLGLTYEFKHRAPGLIDGSTM
jgi:hypothetical protein